MTETFTENSNDQIGLSDFTKYELGNGLYYYSVIVGGYEITLEPHMFLGFNIGLYKAGDPGRWALEKMTVYYKNHPKDRSNSRAETDLLVHAIKKANALINKRTSSYELQ